ncbi:MAG: HAD-IIB family hydrolase [Chloroflexi bacterium]|nr:HAD-IIB family hydrolase [Chloroflexota bacterium]
MKNFDTITPAECKRIRGVLFDIDDTFTHEGRMVPAAFQALWDLHEAGLIVVPITGRPAGWCDHFARMWPVDGVVGENGAFYYYYDREAGKLRQRYVFTPEQAAHRRGELESIRQEVLRRVPAAGVASDQPFRLFDLAIDFREDVSPLSEPEIDDICRVFAEHQATYKISSIHVNGWFGDYNKLSTAMLFLEERFFISREEAVNTMLFAGDSPNDEPMFEAIELTVGVANIKHFSHKMRHLPKYVTGSSGGHGFAEMARVILEKRKQA